MADTETLTPEVEAAAKERVNGILHSQLVASLEAVPDAPQAPPARRPRSDKGIPRKPAAEPVASGGITEQERIRLCTLLEDVIAAERAYWTAGILRNKAGIAYNAYLDSLKAKGGKA